MKQNVRQKPLVLLLSGKRLNMTEYRAMQRVLPAEIRVAEFPGEAFEELLLHNYAAVVVARDFTGVDAGQLYGAMRFCRPDIAILTMDEMLQEIAHKQKHLFQMPHKIAAGGLTV